MTNPIHSFQSAISQNTTLFHLVNRAQSLSNLQSSLKKHLPIDCQTRCKIAKYSEDVLTLSVENGNWLHKLRYLENTLLAKLKQEPIFHSIKKIKYAIDPALHCI